MISIGCTWYNNKTKELFMIVWISRELVALQRPGDPEKTIISIYKFLFLQDYKQGALLCV